jgi:hypothetical protein
LNLDVLPQVVETDVRCIDVALVVFGNASWARAVTKSAATTTALAFSLELTRPAGGILDLHWKGNSMFVRVFVIPGLDA